MGAALSVPLIRFALHPLLAKTTDIGWSDVGQIDEFASMTAPVKRFIKVEQRDAWRKIVSEKPVYVLPVKDGTCECFRQFARISGVRSHGMKANNSSSVHVMSPSSAKTVLGSSGPAPRSMDDLDTKVENGMLKVRYQYFRQLIPTKEALS